MRKHRQFFAMLAMLIAAGTLLILLGVDPVVAVSVVAGIVAVAVQAWSQMSGKDSDQDDEDAGGMADEITTSPPVLPAGEKPIPTTDEGNSPTSLPGTTS